ncbi:MAG: hypothetical protein JXR61_00010 [Prolixibacteraceae bacterium]|nr:hypothetical protein [Prolixibacteraceae bacterium]
MMKINRNNYETYFLDYLEGNLDEKLVDDFLEFLQKNPDLKKELALFQSVSLEPEEIQFDKKEQLYKNKFDLENHFNNASIALMEGDLSSDEKTAFENYLNAHPNKKKEFLIFQRTKLHPDLSISFNKKSNLYHRSTGKTILMWSYRVAAVFVLAFIFYVLADQYSAQKMEESKMAVIEKEKSEKETQQKESPVKTDQKQDQKQIVEEKDQKAETKSEEKSNEPEIAKPVRTETKSVKENKTEPTNQPDITIDRIQNVQLESMATLTVSLNVEMPQANLKSMQYSIPKEPVYNDEERLFADVVKEKTGLDKLSFIKIAKTGLNIVSGISKEKFSYETNESGKVTEINYDSRLFAFSIPTENEAGK